MTQDLSVFREYLMGLGIPVSNEFPPIGVGSGPGSGQTHVLGSLPVYRSDAKVAQGWLTDRKAITAQYANYAFEAMLTRRTVDHPSASTLQDLIAASAFAGYFNWSFWDNKPDNASGYWNYQLWEIRCVFGKEFTDKLVSFALRSIIDSPEEGADPDFDLYFYRKLRVADAVVDSDAQRMDKIQAIIEKFGINVTKPRAELDFAATARKKVDGSFAADITVSNKSEVSADHGHVQVYFSPDVRLVHEPKGSTKDESTTLESARIIPFDSIAPHSVLKIQIEFHPIAELPDGGVVLGLRYKCDTCANDTYDHSLGFRWSRLDDKDL